MPAAPALLSTEFQVPAPADPAERAKLATQLKDTSQGLLTTPLSDFFGRDVTVKPLVELQEPTRKPPAAAAAPVAAPPRTPRTLPRTPLPKPSPSPEPKLPVLQEEVEATVVEEVPLGGAKPKPKTARPKAPVPLPAPAQANASSEVELETPTVPLHLPKLSPRPIVNLTRTTPLPAVNRTAPSPSPAPKVIVWSQAPPCKAKPDGRNSMPGEPHTGVLAAQSAWVCEHVAYKVRHNMHA